MLRSLDQYSDDAGGFWEAQPLLSVIEASVRDVERDRLCQTHDP